MVAAMTTATGLRILIKSSDLLERASEVDTLVLDKTGTVTVGAPAVVAVRCASAAYSARQLLAIGASCGFGSLHPVSRAVVAAARAEGVDVIAPAEVHERPGLGVVADIEGRRAALGRRELLVDIGVQLEPEAEEEREGTEVWVALGTELLGSFMLSDQPREEARDALAQMRALGIDRHVLLTGDRKAIARKIGDALGMDEVIAEVLPAEKLEVVRSEQAKGRTVMMVGDGVNDALALSGADVGVAIGAEVNEVALGGADVALLGADLGRLPQLLRLADLTRSVIGQNVWLAFGFAAVLIILAAVGVLDPLRGALAQSVAVIAVVLNSARILRLGQ
jgi:Cu+-exporting ATPase